MKKLIFLCLVCFGFLAVPKVQAQSMSHTECHDPRCKGLFDIWYIDINSSEESVLQGYLLGETVLGVSPGNVKWTLEDGLLTLRVKNQADMIMGDEPLCIQIAVTDGYYHVEMRKRDN